MTVAVNVGIVDSMTRILPFGKVTFTIAESTTDDDWHATNSVDNIVAMIIVVL
jgi:hypothetical protein